MLERMSPWEYQEIRKVLGHGSGFDSPGWRELRHVFPRLGQAFHSVRRAAGLSIADVYVRGREHEDLYGLAEALLELDESAQHWRMRHYQVVARVIGDKVVGTQGTPVELLGRLIATTSFPELWEVGTSSPRSRRRRARWRSPRGSVSREESRRSCGSSCARTR